MEEWDELYITVSRLLRSEGYSPVFREDGKVEFSDPDTKEEYILTITPKEF
jgi:hypothetical protein